MTSLNGWTGKWDWGVKPPETKFIFKQKQTVWICKALGAGPLGLGQSGASFPPAFCQQSSGFILCKTLLSKKGRWTSGHELSVIWCIWIHCFAQFSNRPHIKKIKNLIFSGSYLQSEQKELHEKNKPDVSSVVTGLSSFLGIRHKMISIQDASADYSQYLFCPYFQFPYVLYSEGLSKC